jgi:hypothetical protein
MCELTPSNATKHMRSLFILQYYGDVIRQAGRALARHSPAKLQSLLIMKNSFSFPFQQMQPLPSLTLSFYGLKEKKEKVSRLKKKKQ